VVIQIEPSLQDDGQPSDLRHRHFPLSQEASCHPYRHLRPVAMRKWDWSQIDHRRPSSRFDRNFNTSRNTNADRHRHGEGGQGPAARRVDRRRRIVQGRLVRLGPGGLRFGVPSPAGSQPERLRASEGCGGLADSESDLKEAALEEP
jgi:hypothetical protein